MGVEVVPNEIHAAAAKLETAASTARRHVPDEVKGVADALAGSESAGAATTLATTWGRRFRGWARRTDALATGMHESARTWSDTDATSRARSERLAREGVL